MGCLSIALIAISGATLLSFYGRWRLSIVRASRSAQRSAAPALRPELELPNLRHRKFSGMRKRTVSNIVQQGRKPNDRPKSRKDFFRDLAVPTIWLVFVIF